MADTENELNLVREQALSSARAAREAEQRKNDLIVYLAHDLKTPLTSVIGYLTLLRDEPQISPGLRAKYTGIALDKAERLEDLINEFFDITRFNLSHLTLDAQTIHLTRMVEQIVYEFHPIFAQKGLDCRTDIAPDVYLIGDSAKLERVFDNLLRNAVNYSYPDTAVTVTLAKPAPTPSSRCRTAARPSHPKSRPDFRAVLPAGFLPRQLHRRGGALGWPLPGRSSSCTAEPSPRRAPTKPSPLPSPCRWQGGADSVLSENRRICFRKTQGFRK